MWKLEIEVTLEEELPNDAVMCEVLYIVGNNVM